METKLNSIDLKNIQIDDAFWNTYINLVDEVILPFQWDLMNDMVEGAEKSHCIQNFKIACGLEKGYHQGMVFQDTDLAKWLEAAAYSLAKKKNPKLEELADYAIDLIVSSQCEDGYINTYYTITGKPRWSNLLEGHELYTAGHMIEAAVAYYKATGKTKFLNAMRRFADCIYKTFGKEDGKIHGYPGHPEVELALVKLYHATGEKKYLELARYFVEERGSLPCYFLGEESVKTGNFIFPEFKDFGLDYTQCHVPIREQKTAEGHAVRAVYLYSAMADLAYEYNDEELLKQCDELWENITEKRMYITGSIGSAAHGERFTADYDLPNNTNYSESCATIGLAMFSNRMFQITKDRKYADVVELALYNTLLAGVALDGRRFFYVNPLETVPEIAAKNPTMRHIKTARQPWFGVACCPPNIARTLASLGNYIYAADKNCIFINLFIANEAKIPLESGIVKLKICSQYPSNGSVKISVSPQSSLRDFSIAVRIPEFSKKFSVKINGNPAECSLEKGYAYMKRKWKENDEIELVLDTSFRFVRCNPKVRGNIGKVCLMKGPWVYCMEEIDNGKYLSSIRIDASKGAKETIDPSLPKGIACAVLQGEKIDYSLVCEKLYSEDKLPYKTGEFKAIPYCLWNNRGEGEMLVWISEKQY